MADSTRTIVLMLALPILALVAGPACSSDSTSCGVPGATAACVCTDGSSGAQACGVDGSWSPCTCDGFDPDGGTAPDTSTEPDTSTQPDTSTEPDASTEPDVPACVPSCDGFACGDDGCGGSCGECADNEQCDDGACVCVPNCEMRECGDDGCGGSCGECPTAAHSCGGAGDVRECTLAAAGEYSGGRFFADITPAGCSGDLVVTVEDSGVVRFNGSSSVRCTGEYERQPLAVNISFIGGSPTIEPPANVNADVDVRIEWAGRGTGLTAGFEGAVDLATGQFNGEITGLPQSVDINGRSFRMSTGTFTAPWP